MGYPLFERTLRVFGERGLQEDVRAVEEVKGVRRSLLEERRDFDTLYGH